MTDFYSGPCTRCDGIDPRYADLDGFDWSRLPPATAEIVGRYRADIERQVMPDIGRPGPAGMGFYLHGPAGTGKTHTANAIAAAAREAGLTVTVLATTELLELFRAYVAKHRPTDMLMADLRGVGLMVLDDVGAERLTGWGAEILYRVVDSRYRFRAAIGWTSNYSLEELEKRIGGTDPAAGARVASRINERSLIVTYQGDDYRIERKRQRLNADRQVSS